MNISQRIAVLLAIFGVFNFTYAKAQSLDPSGEHIVPFKAHLTGTDSCAELEISLEDIFQPFCADDDGCLMRVVHLIEFPDDEFSIDQDWIQMSAFPISGYIDVLITRDGYSRLFRTIGDGIIDVFISAGDDWPCLLNADHASYPDNLVLRACSYSGRNSSCTLRIDD